MDKKTVVALGLGVVAVGGVLFYMKSQKEKSDANANLRIAQAVAESEAEAEAEAVIVAQQVEALPPPPAYVPPLRRIEVQKSKSGGWVGIVSNSRRKASATLDIGDQGMINGTIPCTVSDFWIDTNGKKGAFKCEGMDYYDMVPMGSRFEW